MIDEIALLYPAFDTIPPNLGINSISETAKVRLLQLQGGLSAAEGLSLANLVCLIAIGLEPGISVNELAERTGYPQQSVSRYVGTLLGRYQEDDQEHSFFPLIEQSINKDDPRKRALQTTLEGEGILRRLVCTKKQ